PPSPPEVSVRRLTVLAAALAIATPTAPAAAAPVPAPDPVPTAVVSFSGSNCPERSLCLYRDANYTGGGIAFRGGDFVMNLGTYGVNDTMSSWSNNAYRDCFWFPHADMVGGGHVMSTFKRINLPPNENDTASSILC
ncbi:peptidase inhibitor family I36 protein, partial [Streptomyces clavuligerus]|uniref:peptidase inhibitor family I36 protein n=1 Tax=Streptomyces clavuligerus TaxID=1901 RepID=UPI001E4C5D13